MLKKEKKMTTEVVTLGNEASAGANYSIAYLRHFLVPKQNLCLKTNLKHRLELRQPIRGRTQAGLDVNSVPLAESCGALLRGWYLMRVRILEGGVVCRFRDLHRHQLV